MLLYCVIIGLAWTIVLTVLFGITAALVLLVHPAAGVVFATFAFITGLAYSVMSI